MPKFQPKTLPRAMGRRWFMIISLSGLSGCGNSSFSHLADTLVNSVAPLRQTAIEPSKVEDIPYASIVAKVGSAPWAILILGKTEGNHMNWFAADSSVLVTMNGRIVRTVGYPRDLRSTLPIDIDPLSKPVFTSSSPVVFRRRIDVVPGEIYGVVVTSKVMYEGAETIEILGKPYQTLRYREVSEATGFDWQFENMYWRSAADGSVLRSIQHAVPKVPPFTVEVGKRFNT